MPTETLLWVKVKLTPGVAKCVLAFQVSLARPSALSQ
jgi:hypothetical protein